VQELQGSFQAMQINSVSESCFIVSLATERILEKNSGMTSSVLSAIESDRSHSADDINADYERYGNDVLRFRSMASGIRIDVIDDANLSWGFGRAYETKKHVSYDETLELEEDGVSPNQENNSVCFTGEEVLYQVVVPRITSTATTEPDQKMTSEVTAHEQCRVTAHELFHIVFRLRKDNCYQTVRNLGKERKSTEDNAADEFARMFLQSIGI
jgi:hypothetical protein